MAAGIDWLRLWHDMPNDPKWRTVARASGQPIALVIATYVHLLVDASQGVTNCHGESRTVTRGVTDVTDEDIASALDVTEDAIYSIRTAMQGRVLDGDKLSGWDQRQPKREDAGNPETGAKSAAERKQAQREREKAARENGDRHDESRDVTKSHDREEKSREEKKHTRSSSDDLAAPFEEFWKSYPKKAAKPNAEKAYRKLKPDAALQAALLAAVALQAKSNDWTKDDGQFVPHAATWLNQRRWEDQLPTGAGGQSVDRFAGAK